MAIIPFGLVGAIWGHYIWECTAEHVHGRGLALG